MPTPKNLLIGGGSQLGSYFNQEDTQLIGARDWFSKMMPINQTYECIIIAFGENRTYLDRYLTADDFLYVNYNLTLKALEKVLPMAARVVIFGTSELWSRCTGPIDLNCSYSYFPTKYVISKFKMVTRVKDIYNCNPKLKIIHPFNFNTIARSGDFLFGKVYSSLLQKKKITLNNTYFYRDLAVVTDIIDACLGSDMTMECIIGSGTLTNVNKLIRQMYSSLGLEYETFVNEDPRYKESTPFIKGPYSSQKSAINTVEWMIDDLLNHAGIMPGISR